MTKLLSVAANRSSTYAHLISGQSVARQAVSALRVDLTRSQPYAISGDEQSATVNDASVAVIRVRSPAVVNKCAHRMLRSEFFPRYNATRISPHSDLRDFMRQIKRLPFGRVVASHSTMKWIHPIERLVEMMVVLWLIEIFVSPYRPRTRTRLQGQ